MGLFFEAGRMALGRSNLRALRSAADTSRASWDRDEGMLGHIDGCIVASLALRASGKAEDVRTASDLAREALGLVDARLPATYAASVRALLGHEPGG
jgi:hypothetical protein